MIILGVLVLIVIGLLFINELMQTNNIYGDRKE